MNERPEVVPALQEWTGGTGEFRLGPESRVVCADERLGSRLAGELGIGHATEGPGDVVLEIVPSGGRAEGYRIEAAPGRVTITAPTARGLFYGTRTLVQILRTGAVPCGVAHDWPDYPVRGYMLDVGRRYVTPDAHPPPRPPDGPLQAQRAAAPPQRQ